MADSGLRQLQILMKIPREPRCITTRELLDYLQCESHNVTTPRTIQRDILALTTSGFSIIPIKREGGSNGKVQGWAFSKESKIKGIPGMDSGMALALLMGLEHLDKLMPPSVIKQLKPLAEEARAVLATFQQNHYQDWADKVRVISSSVLAPPAIEPDALTLIHQALLENRRFRATYNGKTERIISPYALVQRDSTQYLLCKIDNYADIRVTAMQRYHNVELLMEPVKPDPDFHVDNYINSGEMLWPWGNTKEKSIKLVLHINDYLVKHLHEAPLSPDQKFSDTEYEDWQQLTATVKDSHHLRYWLVSQGDNLEVLAPKGMRNWFAEISGNLYDYYHGE